MRVFILSSVIIIFLSFKVSSDNLYVLQDSLIVSNENTTLLTPIIINDDNDFLTYGCMGTGTFKDPYRIENLTFDLTDETAIDISYTTKYFTITNCSFYSNKWNIKISFVSDNTSQIISNDFTGIYGIYIKRTNNFTISNNQIQVFQRAILIEKSHNFTITNNYCQGGIKIEDSSRSEIDSNTIVYTYSDRKAMDLKRVSTLLVRNNTIKENWLMMYLDGVTDSLIQNNFFKDNEIGLMGQDTYNTNITENIIVSTKYHAINFWEGNANCTITNNILVKNRWSGASSSSQAIDYAGLTWYNQTTLTGNYWSNWRGEGEYIITVNPTFTVSDPYPITAGDEDNDGLNNYLEEYYYLTDKLDNDTDGDMLLDGEEIVEYETDPLKTDSDRDGLQDGEEVYTYGTLPADPDTDNDLLFDGKEVLEFGTDPTLFDSDGDGIDDGFEVIKGLDPLVDDAAEDPDEDGLINIQEYEEYSNPLVNDTDGDMLLDGEEVYLYNTRPIFPDTDLDGLKDGEEVLIYGTDPTRKDSDGDGLTDSDELLTLLTDPLNTDSDFDGMPDKWEVDRGLNPLVDDSLEDPDEDKLNNLEEYIQGTSPRNPDTDEDGWLDGVEVRRGTDPLNITDYPLSNKEIASRVGGIIIGVLGLLYFILYLTMKVKGWTWKDLRNKIKIGSKLDKTKTKK